MHNNFWSWTPAIFKLSLNERLWIFHWGCVIIYCDFIMVKVPSPNALNCVIIDSKVDRVKVKKSESISVHSPHSLGQNQGKWVLTTKPLEDVSQGHSNQVLDCICTQSNMTSRQSPWTDGVNSVGDTSSLEDPEKHLPTVLWSMSFNYLPWSQQHHLTWYNYSSWPVFAVQESICVGWYIQLHKAETRPGNLKAIVRDHISLIGDTRLPDPLGLF